MINNEPSEFITTVVPPARPLSPGDIAAYHALQSHAVYWESPLVWSSFRGDKAISTLNGLITNDVATQAEGTAIYAAALSPKGKLVTDMHVVRVSDTTLFVGVHPTTASDWLALTKKYVNPRLCKVTDESSTLHSWLVYGQSASHIADSLQGLTAHVVPARVMGDAPGVFVIVNRDDVAQRAQVEAALTQAGAHKGTVDLWNVLRIESGYPEMGVEMDENTIPQEANLDTLGAISFSKGCYTGQETVARVHFRGHVNKHLRGLASGELVTVGASVTVAGTETDADIVANAADGAQAGADVKTDAGATGKMVGTVKSVAQSPRLGPIALAMVRREVAIGATVHVAGSSAAIPAQVIELPF